MGIGMVTIFMQELKIVVGKYLDKNLSYALKKIVK
mgnify:CR=1 FL=1